MAASNLNLGKASGGVLNVQPADGTTTTSIVLPASGTVTTNEYVNSNNLGNGSTTFNGFGGTGFKNYIINGNFDVWQYKDAGLTYPQTSSGYGSDDRWFNLTTVSTKTHSQIACTDTERALFNASYFSRTVATSVAGAGNYVVKAQRVENITKLAGKIVTLSFWAKADSAKNIAIEFTQNFGTGGTSSSVVTSIGSQLVALTTTWQKKTITLTIPSIAGKTLGADGIHTSFNELIFWFDAGSSFNTRSANLGQQSGTFDIAQVQLEEGSVATPFEQRPYGLELSLCQRYYKTLTPTTGQSISATSIQFTMNFGEMRISPSLSLSPGTLTVSDDTSYDKEVTPSMLNVSLSINSVRILLGGWSSLTYPRYHSVSGGLCRVTFSSEL